MCPRCQHTEVRPTLVTSWKLYLRCSQCGHVWVLSRDAENSEETDVNLRPLTGSACRKCGGPLRESSETVPYVVPGPCVVELQKVAVRRCSVCGDMAIDVPDAPGLDVLMRCLRVESTHVVPQLEYADGRWRISGRASRSG